MKLSSSESPDTYAELSRQIFKIAEKRQHVGTFLKESSKILSNVFGCTFLKITINDIKNDRLIISRFAGDGHSVKFKPALQPMLPDTEPLNLETSANDLEDLFLGGWFNFTSDLYFLKEGLHVPKGETYPIPIQHNNQHDSYILKSNKKDRLFLPMKYQDTCIGLATLFFSPNKAPIPGQYLFFKNLTQATATALMYRLSEERQRERVKELQCVYQITKLGAEGELSINGILQQAVSIIPDGFYFPEHAACKIMFEDHTYVSRDYSSAIHKMMEPIVIDSQEKGFVKVFYVKRLDEFEDHPFLKEEGKLLHAIAEELSSIIQRKRIEEEKQSLQTQLWHSDRLAKIGQLAAGVAHELNEPLSSILGFAQLIQKTPHIPEQADQDLHKIVSASIHARDIVKKLMMFSRQMPPEKTRIHFNNQIKEGLYLLESRLRKGHIELIYDLADNLPQITLDPSQLNQVLVNLIVNAIQAMEGKGVLKISTQLYKNGIRLSIQDNGKGMTPAEKDQAFIPFFTTKEINEGTGLGLSVVHGIMLSHQGSIDLKSQKGRGTTVHVFFPE